MPLSRQEAKRRRGTNLPGICKKTFAKDYAKMHIIASGQRRPANGGECAMCAESLLYCVFPHGNPGEPGFGFCGEPAVWGRPYCQHHCSIAYIGHHERQRILSEIEVETNLALQRLASAPDLTAEQLAAQ
jgi:hypothetical protein